MNVTSCCQVSGGVRVWVRQHLAQHDPDVDAIYRLTSPLPVYFTPERSTGLGLPVNTFVPYNAQATFHYHEVGKEDIFLSVDNMLTPTAHARYF